MHPLTLIESCRISWRPKRGCKHSWLQVVHFRSGSNVRESPLLVQIFVSMLTHTVTRIYLRKKAGFPGSIGTHSWGCVSTYWEGQNTGKQSGIPAQRSGYRKQLSRGIVIPSFPVTKDNNRSLFLLCCVNSDLCLRWFNVLSPQGHNYDFCCFALLHRRLQQATKHEQRAPGRQEAKNRDWGRSGEKKIGAWKEIFLSAKI